MIKLKPITKILREYQVRFNEPVWNFLINSDEKISQAYSPTGSGKTVCFEDMITKYAAHFNDKQLNIAIVHPRLALSQDQLTRFKKTFDVEFHFTSFHSGSHVRGNEEILEKSTTCSDELEKIITNSGKTHLTFSSYASFGKIQHIEFDLVIFDEGHNLTQKQFYPILLNLKAKKAVIYTATPIVKELFGERETDSEEPQTEEITISNDGMDNFEVFGKIISKIYPSELIKPGYIIGPVVHIMDVETDKKGCGVNTLEIVSAAWNDQIKFMSKYKMPFHQMLVTSRGYSDHEMIEKNLAQFKKMIGSNDVEIYIIESGSCRRNGIINNNNDRQATLNEIKSLGKSAIVIHYDTLAEGIDIDTLTGACILRNISKSKILQTVGRCGRPYFKDLNEKGEIIDIDNRIKPVSIITFPSIDGESLCGNDVVKITNAFIAGGYNDLSEKGNFVVSGPGGNGGPIEPRDPLTYSGIKNARIKEYIEELKKLVSF